MSDSDCGSRGLAAEIGLQIPGFKGYLRREFRRDADRVQREFLVKKLKGAKDSIEAVKRDLAMKGGAFARHMGRQGVGGKRGHRSHAARPRGERLPQCLGRVAQWAD